MDSKLISLRRQEIETFKEFLKARRAYLEAAAPSARKSDAELIETLEEYLKAAEPYETALQELREYLQTAELSETMAAELGHAEGLIRALHKEKRVGSKLLERYIKLTGRHTEEEEE
jgi:predicted RNA-binding protein with EMAP domain